MSTQNLKWRHYKRNIDYNYKGNDNESLIRCENKNSRKSLISISAQRFDDSMSSFSSEKRVKFDNLIYTVQNYLLKFVTCYMHTLRFIAFHGIY